MFSQITFLGTNSAIPLTGKRNTSSIAINTTNGNIFLFDCGEATLHQIMRCSQVKMEKISHIFITHLHGDHCFGIFGILSTLLSNSQFTKKLFVYGPKNIKNMVCHVMNCSTDNENYVNDSNVEFIELEHNKSYDLGLIANGFHVTAHPLTHRIPTFGYVIQEPDIIGKLNVQKAINLGALPNTKMMSMLKNGEDVKLENGHIIKSSDVVLPKTDGLKISIFQDTYSSELAYNSALNSDVLIHECTYFSNLKSKAEEWLHSTSEMAGKCAKDINAKMLILTHFSSRYMFKNQTKHIKKSRTDPIYIEDLVCEAEKQCPNTKVLAAKDFMRLYRNKDHFEVDKRLAITEHCRDEFISYYGTEIGDCLYRKDEKDMVKNKGLNKRKVME